MEFQHLQSFAAVAESGNLTRASERLHLSQPAVSAHIKALEEELDVVLFDRVSSGMELTARGRKLLVEAGKVMAAAQELKSRALALHGQVEGRVVMGTLADPEFTRLGDLLAQAVERYPLLSIELRHEVTGEAFDKVRDGMLDASFYFGERTHPAVAALPLREIAYRVAAPAAWQARIDRADWEGIAAEPWILPPPVSTIHALAISLFGSRGIMPVKLVEVDNENVIRSLVAAGVGVALIREDLALADRDAGELCIWRDVRPRTTLAFLYPRERAREPALAALERLVADVWKLPAAGLAA